jgi:DNA-binding NarL/FixJ family response regulator
MSFTHRRTARPPSLLAELTGLRVHVNSEEPVIRAGIRSLLASRTETLTFADDLREGAADVVLYDVIGLHLRGCQDLEALARSHPGRVLALSRALQPGLTARALALGAVAAVPLGAAPDELLLAIHDLFEGRFQDGSPADLANRRDRDHRLGGGACLSPREQDVLSLIVAGASNQEISAQLNITANTVKSFIRAAYQKIGVSTRAQAAAWGVDHGFPTQPETP